MKRGNLNFDVAGAVNRLPAMAANVDELIDALGKEDLRERLERLARKDPAICAEMMYLANTHCFGNADAARTLEDVLHVPDLEGMAQIVAATFATRDVEEGLGFARNIGNFFSHSQEISSTAKILGQICGVEKEKVQNYATAGLMHDVGRVVISAVTQQECAPLMGASVEKLAAIVKEEKETIGMDHCEVGMELARKWGFCESMQKGILRHHTPATDGGLDHLGGVIFLGHFVGADEFTGEMLEKNVPGEILRGLGINAKGFEEAKRRFKLKR